MSTITSRQIINDIVNGNGMYPGDSMRVVKIVQYTSKWGGRNNWGCIYEGGNLDNYAESDHVIDPEVYWEYKK